MRSRPLVLLLLATAALVSLLTVPAVLPSPAGDSADRVRSEAPGGSPDVPDDGALPGHAEPIRDPVTAREPAAEAAVRAPSAGRPSPAPPTPPSVSDALAGRLAELASSSAVERERVGLIVLTADGAPLLEEHADRPLLPASTQKLVTAASALLSLGPDFRYTTTVGATAPADDRGVVDGDLVLVGSGDPTLATPVYAQAVYPARPHTPLVALADDLVDAGITRVSGNVVGDATAFTDEPAASGWLPEYFASLDATHVSGLTVDAGRRIFERNGRLVAEVADRPAGVAARALRDLLEERDVAVEGRSGTTSRPPDARHQLAGVTSPPLDELLTFMVQHSDNHLADAIYRTVGSHSVGVGSWTGAAAGTLTVLDELGVDWTGAVLADGSGLSRDDRLTARQLATLDAAMTDSEFGELWGRLMALAGESGTLQGRLRGTLAEGRLRGKTGTLRDVRSLSGAVVGPGDDRYHFAVLGNGLDGKGIRAVRRLQDDLAVALAEDLEGCERVPLEDDEQGYDLVCDG